MATLKIFLVLIVLGFITIISAVPYTEYNGLAYPYLLFNCNNTFDSTNTCYGLKFYNQATDFFSDTATVNDSFVVFAHQGSIGLDSIGLNLGKFQGLSVTVNTPLSASNINITWEYACKNSCNVYTNVWCPFENVTDGTNNFQNSGNITWNIPKDWINYNRIQYGANYYYYGFIARARINSISGLSEGGNTPAYGIKTFDGDLNFYQYPVLNFSYMAYLDDINGWNCIDNTTTQFFIKCDLAIRNYSTVLISKNEQVTFDKNIHFHNYGNIQLGSLLSGDKVYDGTDIIFDQYYGDYLRTYLTSQSNSTFYNSQIKGIGNICNSFWGANIGYVKGNKIYDTFFQSFRNLNFNNNYNSISGVKAYNAMVENPGAVIDGLVGYGGSYSTRPSINNIGHYIHRWDMSAVTASPMNPYFAYNDNFYMFVVDSNFGGFNDTYKAYWNYPGNNNSIYITNSILLRAVDSNGNPIFNATLNITDNLNNNYIFYSNEDGYFGIYSGNVTTGYSNAIIDSSKTYTPNSLFFKEIYLTGGKGHGERKIIMVNNTNTIINVSSTYLNFPDSTTRYIIVPYITTKKLYPTNTGVTASWSSSIDYNNFTFVISKQNYTTLSYTANIDNKAIDSVVVLNEGDGTTTGIWNYSIAPVFAIRNQTTTTVFKISPTGDLAIAGDLYEHTNSPPIKKIIWKIGDLIYLTVDGDLYIKGSKVL